MVCAMSMKNEGFIALINGSSVAVWKDPSLKVNWKSAKIKLGQKTEEYVQSGLWNCNDLIKKKKKVYYSREIAPYFKRLFDLK